MEVKKVQALNKDVESQKSANAQNSLFDPQQSGDFDFSNSIEEKNDKNRGIETQQ